MQFLVDRIADNNTRNRIECIKAVRLYSGLGLEQSKDIVDEIIFHNAKVITIPFKGGHGNPQYLVQELLKYGVAVTVRDELKDSLYATFKVAMDNKNLKVARSILDICIDIEGQ